MNLTIEIKYYQKHLVSQNVPLACMLVGSQDLMSSSPNV